LRKELVDGEVLTASAGAVVAVLAERSTRRRELAFEQGVLRWGAWDRGGAAQRI
jgi:hypothetical protein